MPFTFDQLKPILTTDRAKRIPESDLRSIVEDTGRWAAVRPSQFKQWVDRLAQSIASLYADDVRVGDVVLFWICLYGLLDEGTDHYRNLDNLRTLVKNPPADIGQEMDRVRAALNLLEEMGEQFSDEEMIAIEYERHCSAHLFQDAYTLRPDKKGSLIRQKGNLDLKEITERILPNEFKKFESEFEMAKDYAARVKDKVNRLMLLI